MKHLDCEGFLETSAETNNDSKNCIIGAAKIVKESTGTITSYVDKLSVDVEVKKCPFAHRCLSYRQLYNPYTVAVHFISKGEYRLSDGTPDLDSALIALSFFDENFDPILGQYLDIPFSRVVYKTAFLVSAAYASAVTKDLSIIKRFLDFADKYYEDINGKL